MKYRILSVFLCFFISACSNEMTLPGGPDIQLVPKKGTVEQVNNIKISYIIPNNKLNLQDIDELMLASRSWGKDSKREKIISSFSNNKLQIERRVDNGVAGSGLIYEIDVDRTKNGNSKVITFTSKTVKTYQDGMILPFPLPKFDLAYYLTSASVLYTFELESEYPVNSIKANFDRLLQSSNSGYELQSHNFSAIMNVKIYPYRKGTKVMVRATLFDMKAIDGTINVSDNIKELELRVNSIIKD